MNADDHNAIGSNQENWYLLIFQLPAKPAYQRVKIWRRLQGIGAIAVKNSVYALPANEETQEDFQWMLREVQEGGGEGMVCEARLIDGLSDPQVRELFDQARDADYEAIAKEARALAQELKNDAQDIIEKRSQVARLRKRLSDVEGIDFFGANGRESAEGLLSDLEAQLKKEEEPLSEEKAKSSLGKIGRGRTWVTRKGVHVDRIASAWLIERFIDPEMKLKFVPAKGYVPASGELRFDMYDAEYTHEGDNCTFEVLLTRAGLEDQALKPIAEIVHDIDLKDGKFGREEVGGVKTLIASICMATAEDEERIRRGGAVFEDLYQYFRKKSAE